MLTIIHCISYTMQDLKKKPNPPPNKPGPFITRKLFRGQDKPESSKLSPPARENTLVDLISSWDDSAQTAPGIQSFIKDESQILQPMKSGGETEEEAVTAESESKPEDLYSVPLRKSKPETKRQHSVQRLSKIFEEKAAALQESTPLSPTAVSPTAVSPTEKTAVGRRSKSPEQKPLPPLPTAEPPATSPTITPTSTVAIYDVPPVADSGDEEFLYQVLYDYTATDATELTIKEGDVVISVAGFTAGMSPGWLMVRQEGELDEGWVPESYLKKLGPAYSPEPTTGTVKSPENQKPMCKLLSHTYSVSIQ